MSEMQESNDGWSLDLRHLETRFVPSLECEGTILRDHVDRPAGAGAAHANRTLLAERNVQAFTASRAGRPIKYLEARSVSRDRSAESRYSH